MKKLIHILILGPLLTYIGIMKPSNLYFYYILFALSISIVSVFIYRYINNGLKAWSFVHLFIFALLLFTISYKKIIDNNVPLYLYSFLIAIGVSSIGYNLIRLVRVN